MAEDLDRVQLSGKAFEPEGDDVLGPAVSMLQGLNLLPTKDDLRKAGRFAAAFGGPPQSVAVLEGGATAVAKWWSVGGTVALGVGWSAVVKVWHDNDRSPATQRSLLFAVAIASAAIILAIGYVLASDVRGRAAATVATLNARAQVVDAVVRAVQGQDTSSAAGSPEDLRITGVPARSVRHLAKRSSDETGWTTLALQAKPDGSDAKLLIAKNDKFEWVSVSQLEYDGELSGDAKSGGWKR